MRDETALRAVEPRTEPTRRHKHKNEAGPRWEPACLRSDLEDRYLAFRRVPFRAVERLAVFLPAVFLLAVFFFPAVFLLAAFRFAAIQIHPLP